MQKIAQADGSPERIPVVVINDQSTPYQFVIDLLSDVFSFSQPRAKQMAYNTHYHGEAEVGWYPEAVASALIEECRRRIQEAGHKLHVESRRTTDSGNAHCSFCGKPEIQARYLLRSGAANMCDDCIVRGANKLAAHVGKQTFTHAHQLLEWHFAGRPNDQIVTSFRKFPGHVRADLQLAVNTLFGTDAVRFVGIDAEHHYEPLNFAKLLKQGNRAKNIAPVQYEDVDVGGDEPLPCAENCLWLLQEGSVRYAVLLARHRSYDGGEDIRVEIAVPAGEAESTLAFAKFKFLADEISAAKLYRGKVLSLEPSEQYSGQSAGIKVHRLPPVSREEVILPDATLRLLDRNVLDFAKSRAELKSLGLSPRKGILLYGPPGTGKTHTIRYLASELPGHTTLLITAEQAGIISHYFALARLLQPSLMVIEDADLIARSRTDMGSACEEVLLNKLLNEMDGLREDAEIFFLLTTNRPEQLEYALAGRPGRIDQAIEVPLPDEVGRKKLVRLYAKGLTLDDGTVSKIVRNTKGVSAAFIKELMRRIAQTSLEHGRSQPAQADAEEAIADMLFNGGRLNASLLGAASAGK